MNKVLRPGQHVHDQRTIGPENVHLKPDLGAYSHYEMTLTLNTPYDTFIGFIISLHLPNFRSQAAIVSTRGPMVL